MTVPKNVDRPMAAFTMLVCSNLIKVQNIESASHAVVATVMALTKFLVKTVTPICTEVVATDATTFLDAPMAMRLRTLFALERSRMRGWLDPACSALFNNRMFKTTLTGLKESCLQVTTSILPPLRVLLHC